MGGGGSRFHREPQAPQSPQFANMSGAPNNNAWGMPPAAVSPGAGGGSSAPPPGAMFPTTPVGMGLDPNLAAGLPPTASNMMLSPWQQFQMQQHLQMQQQMQQQQQTSQQQQQQMMEPLQSAMQIVTAELKNVLAELQSRRQAEEDLRTRMQNFEGMLMDLKKNNEYLDQQNNTLRQQLQKMKKRGSEAGGGGRSGSSGHHGFGGGMGAPSPTGGGGGAANNFLSVLDRDDDGLNVRRRTAISSEVTNATASDVNLDVEIKVVPKNEEERARLRRALANNILFAGLEERDMMFVFDAMFQKRYNAGDVIMRQGDVGDNFYVLDEGEVKITIERENGKNKVFMAQAGETFGELALMYGTPRAATIEAVTKARCWCIDRFVYRKILANQIMKKRDKYTKFLKNIPILKDIDAYETQKIADVLDACDYADGDVIVHEGNLGDTFFIIEEGTVVVSKGGQFVGELHQCEYFGELSLLYDRRRAATVTAKGSVRCLRLHRKYFNSYMTSIEEIMKRNAISHYGNDTKEGLV